MRRYGPLRLPRHVGSMTARARAEGPCHPRHEPEGLHILRSPASRFPLMKRVVVKRPGGIERLVIEEGENPITAKGEVCVEVRGIGVNFADLVVRLGLYRSAKEYVGWPITPGFEVSGTVSSVGD